MLSPEASGITILPYIFATDKLLLEYENCPYESIEKTFIRFDPSAIIFVPSPDSLLLPKNCCVEPKMSFPIFNQCLGSV